MGRHRVVVIGSGFGGLFAVRALRRAAVEVTLISRTTHHLFQPLLYQVATGILSEGEIAPSTREVLARQRNARVILGEVTGIDLASRTVTSELHRSAGRQRHATLTEYDSLIVAAGSDRSYFGREEFSEFAPGLKTLDDALELRGRIFGAFEVAELADSSAETERALTFVVVGAGPTGVELAGQIAELSRRTLRRDFRRVDPTRARVVLVEAQSRVLSAFGERLGRLAHRRLERLGVEVRLGVRVVGMDATGIDLEDVDRPGARHRIETLTKVWAAGVQASELARHLADQTGAALDRAGRIAVRDDLTLPGHPEVFVVGDMITLEDYPGVAQLAIQAGRHAARQIVRRLDAVTSGRAQTPESIAAHTFRYRDRGNMATISRFSAVASIGRVQFGGLLAWTAWLALHLVYLIGFKQRVTTLLHWAVSFVGRGRVERAVTEQQIFARTVMEHRDRGFPPEPG